MASLAKTNKSFQRLHRERHQPQNRSHLGFLEKKKDYKVRALDRQKKERTIKLLSEKVANKNPNEFTFHMMNSQLSNGKHFEKRKDDDKDEEIKVIEAKNMKFLNWKRAIELKKIERLKSTLHFIDIDDEPQNKHIFFKEGPKKKLKIITKDPSSSNRSNTDSSSKKPKHSKPVKEIEDSTIATVSREKTKAYEMLMKRLEREKRLRSLVEKGDFTLKPRGSIKGKNKFDDDAD